MATPTLTLINAGAGTLTDGFVGTNADAESVTGWTDFDTLDTDIKVQGSNAITGIGRANNEDMYYDDGSAAITAAGKVFRAWFQTVNTPYMGTLTGSNPYELLFYDGTTSTRKAMLGSDTYEGGWVYVFQDMDLVTTTNSWSANVTLANVQRWGWTTGHDSNAKNVDNCWADAFRYLDGYYLTGGTSGDKVTIADVFTADMGGATPSAYGIVQRSRGIYFATGTIQIGNGATTTWFEMDGEVLQFIDTVGLMEISAGLYEISATGTGCDCSITGSVIRGGPGGDASTRIYFDFSDTDHTLTFTNNLVVNGGTVVFASGQTATGNTFDDCLQITHGGADMDNCTIQNYEGATGTAAMLYNVNADPDGEMDGLTFVKGTATTHALELGSNTPSSITLRDWTVSGYNASNGQNDSVIYNNSGKAITINVAGNTGTISYRNGTGASTTISANPATTTITVRDVNDNSLIEGARVLLIASDGTGPLPYQETVTSITFSGDGLPSTGDVLDERFEGTGYEESWTEYVSGTSVLNEDYATSGLTSPPTDWEDQCLRVLHNALENSFTDTTFTEQSAAWHRMSFYIETAPATGDSMLLFSCYDDSARIWQVEAYNNAGTLQLYLTINTDGTDSYYSQNISADTYYDLEVKYDTDGESWEWRLDDSTLDSGTLDLVASDLLDERFEGTGYEETWTEYTQGTSTLDEDFATSGLTSPPASWGDQCLELDKNSGEDCYIRRNIGSDEPIIYFRIEFMVDTLPATGTSFGLFRLYDASYNGLATCAVYNSSGTPTLVLSLLHDGANNFQYPTFTLDSYNVIEVYWNSTDDEAELWLNGSARYSLPTLTGGAATRTFRIIDVGDFAANDGGLMYVDNVLMSSTGLPSLDPLLMDTAIIGAGNAWDVDCEFYVGYWLIDSDAYPTASGAGVATVTHTGHGLTTGDIAYITGANQEEYNGARIITVTDANTYTYTLDGTPTTPATGTITSTGGVFNDLTSASGVVTDTRAWSTSQPFTGRVRKSTGASLYRTSPLTGTINSTNGFAGTVFLIPDE